MKGVLSVFVPGSTSSYLRAKDVINQQDPDVSQFPRSHDTGCTNTSITKLQCSHLENTERPGTTGVYLTTGQHIPCIQCLYWRRKNLESHVSFCICHTPPLDTATESFLNEINPVIVFSSPSSYFYVSGRPPPPPPPPPPPHQHSLDKDLLRTQNCSHYFSAPLTRQQLQCNNVHVLHTKTKASWRMRLLCHTNIRFGSK
jgi:hypothetical protein